MWPTLRRVLTKQTTEKYAFSVSGVVVVVIIIGADSNSIFKFGL
jgi:hypothetical protein